MPVNFDVQAARKAGYSDAEIADTIAAKVGFNSAGARQAGHSDQEIIGRLMTDTPPKPQQVQAAAQAVSAPPARQLTSTQQGSQEVADQMGTGETILVGAGRTFDRIGKGMQQGWNALTGNKEAQAKLKAEADDEQERYGMLQEANPIASAIGETLPSMAIPIGSTAKLGTTIAKMAAASAIPNALEYGTPEERAKRAAIGAAGGVVGGVVIPKAAGAVVNAGKSALKGIAGNITPEALALAARAKELGIPVNAAQLGDSKFLKTLASSIEQMPFTGGAKAGATQRTAYTQAVGKTFGADVEKVTPEVYNYHKKRLGAQFDDLAARNELKVTPELKTKLTSIIDAAESTAADDTIRAAKNIFGRVSDQAKTTGGDVPAQMSRILDANGAPVIRVPASSTPSTTKLPGSTYSSIDSELSSIIKAGGEKGMYAKQMQEAIRNAMDDSIEGADKALWSETRNQYKNLKAVRDIVAKDGGDGNIPPTQLMNALNNSEAGKEAMAMGTRGTLGELGQIGKQFVRDSVPNSGTAQRAMAMGLIGGSGYAFGADPKTIAGMMVGGATLGRVLNKLMTNPKVVAALGARGISQADLAKLPPKQITQIIGGLTGMTAAEMEAE